MLRVLVETVKYRLWITFNRHRHTGKCLNALICFGSSSICYVPQAIAIALGGFDGGFDDIGHYFTTHVRYQWFGWFHNTKEYSSL
mmetsp:Transcript_23540/g.33619  ORF Transcript_23540/g.33619 Transcript_23540/m.33619 type:complete len:85 (+) Transcript_23540:669-923(+)